MSKVVAILNNRYDICVIKPAEPCPHIVGAFDPGSHVFVLGDLVDGDDVDPSAALHACAAALNEQVISEDYL